jgi:16S rRNA (guanine527-N7)-methyltransferase
MSGLLKEGLLQLMHDDPDIDRLFNGRFNAIQELLEKYVCEIELFNEAYGLVNVQSHNELIVKHILDSLAPLGILLRILPSAPASNFSIPDSRSSIKIADIGSGAGLPGIPLAIALPGIFFTLVEKMGRRAGFLKNSLALLALPNAGIIEKEMEKLEAEQFDLIICRAFKPLSADLIKKFSRLLKAEGSMAFYKGRLEKTAEEIRESGIGDTCELVKIRVPFLNEERHVLVLKTQKHNAVHRQMLKVE